MNERKEFETLDDLANLLKIKPQKLAYILYKKNTDSMYTPFTIPKKNGGERTICAPNDELKYIQKTIDIYLRNKQKTYYKDLGIRPNLSHAFIEEKNILTNSTIHTNKRYVLNIDLKDFFDSFHFGRVRGYFYKNRNFSFSLNVATMLAQLTCYNGKLPQGAPSSPIITDLICNITDIRILKIAKKYKLDYTRYADDLTFSTNNTEFINKYDDFLKEITKIIEGNGFKINENKTKFMYRTSHQEVTGITVNKKTNINKNYYTKTRAMADCLYANGFFTNNNEPSYLPELEGRFSYIDYVSYYHNGSYDKQNINRLLSKQKEIQKFLFYKYFVVNSKPLIVTEGKTDSRYLKSAIMSLYNEYPILITKNKYHYDFNINFLKRTKKIERYMGISHDGADTLQNIYNLYNGYNNITNYTKVFNDKYNIKPSNPIIILLDNEMTSKDKPLHKFINSVYKGNKEELKKQLNEKNYVFLRYNLYLVTIPLCKEKAECEIEDLLPDSVLETKIGEKVFNRKAIGNMNQYSKEILSNHVLNNFSKIDFSGFKPLLSIINKIINEYNSREN